MGVHQPEQIWREAHQRRLTLGTGHVGSNHVDSVHAVGHKNLGTLDRFVTPFLNLVVRVCLVLREHEPLVDSLQSSRDRPETHVFAHG